MTKREVQKVQDDIKKLKLKIKESELFEKTETILKEIWEKQKKEFKYLFELRLYQYTYGKHFDYTNERLLREDKKARTQIINSYRKKKTTKNGSSLAKRFQRLSLGYNAIPYNLTPKRVNLSSKAANDEKDKKKTVNDHIIGATLIAEYIIYIFQKGKESKNLDWVELDWLDERLNYMCDIWLKDNLWLWTTCRITKDEHNPKKGGVPKIISDDILKEIIHRVNFNHYSEAPIGITVCDYV